MSLLHGHPPDHFERVIVTDHTPAEIVADVIEERGRLYWEMVGKFVDNSVEEWKTAKPSVTILWDLLENACRAHGKVAFEDPFNAFIVLKHSKHPNAALYNNTGKRRPIDKVFAKGLDFPWVLVAVNAFYSDCASLVNERLAEDFKNLEVLPHG